MDPCLSGDAFYTNLLEEGKMIMNDTAYKWKDQGASLLKIASLVTALTLRNFSLVHSSRGYYVDAYPGKAYHQQAGQTYHSQFRALTLSARPTRTHVV